MVSMPSSWPDAPAVSGSPGRRWPHDRAPEPDETEPTYRPPGSRHTLGPCPERALSGRHDDVRGQGPPRRPHRRSPRDRGRHRRHRPHPDRPRLQGVPQGRPAGRPLGAGRARSAGEAARPRPPDDRRPLLGLRRPQRRPRVEPGPRHRRARRHGPPPGRDREPVLRQLDPDHADGVPRDQGGEGDTFLVGGVECVSKYTSFAGAGGSDADAQNPRFADAAARSAETARTNATWTDPREEGLLPDVYLAMGQTAENVATSRGVSRQRQDDWGVTSQNRAEKAIADGFFAREILPVALADGTVVSRDDGPRAGVTLEGVQGSTRCSVRTAPSPPATAAPSTTAPPGWSS